MNVLITGSSGGIGSSTARLFLQNGHTVFGIDTEKSPFDVAEFAQKYTHFVSDISKKESLPELPPMNIVLHCAGLQTAKKTAAERDIEVNLLGTIYVTEKYAFNEQIKSMLFISSVSALNGNEFPSYVASKAGMNGYMRHCAIRLANEYKATCNALCFGGVTTKLNEPVMQNKKLWNRIMDVTPLKRWMTAEEAAAWCYFMTVTNTFCTGQEIDISGGERNCADLFVWE